MNLKSQNPTAITTTTSHAMQKHDWGKWLFVFEYNITWTESALTISPLRRLASSNARRLLPEPVGPEITITFSFFFLSEAVTKNRRRKVREHWRGRNSDLSGKRKQVRRVQTPLLIMVGVAVWVRRAKFKPRYINIGIFRLDNRYFCLYCHY